jgi:hypothetical protein
MRTIIFRIVAVIGLCWAILALISLASELRFLVDGLNWAVSFSPSVKAALLTIGKRLTTVVLSYREFLIGFSRVLHLPVPPHNWYDVAGIMTTAVGRGLWLSHRTWRIAGMLDEMQAAQVEEELRELTREETDERRYQIDALSSMGEIYTYGYERFEKQIRRYLIIALAMHIRGFEQVLQDVFKTSFPLQRLFDRFELGGHRNQDYPRYHSVTKRIRLAIICDVIYGGFAAAGLSVLFAIDCIYRALAT